MAEYVTRAKENDESGASAAGPGGGIRLGRVFGVEIFVDWSLLIIFALIVFNLGAAVFPSWHPNWSWLLVWGVAIGAAVLFFVSVLAHELSHAVVARAQDVPVRRITLFLFGGMAHMEAEPRSPKAELLIAIVGPITSVAIGVLATFAGTALASQAVSTALTGDDPAAMEWALASVGPIATLLLWLGPINILLGLFNMIPGFPLDGGRVLRAIVWAITGDIVKATRWASFAGQLVAWTLMAIGVMSIFAGGFLQGIWLLLIGWFLNHIARMSYHQLLVRQALADVPVARVMRTHLDRVPPDISVETFVRDHLMVSDQKAFPVESGGDLLGLVAFEDVRRVPQAEWERTPIRTIMTPVDQLTTLPPDAAAERALEELARADVNQIPILDGRHLLGFVRGGDLLKWLSIRGTGRDRVPV